MADVLLIAGTTVREVRHRRVLWVLVLVGGLLLALMVAPMAMMQMARESGEGGFAKRMSFQMVDMVVGAFVFAASVFAVFLGATVVSTEAKTRTIVTVLAHPIERWQFLVGRWLGVQLFSLLVVAVGVACGVALAWWLDLPLPNRFWVLQLEAIVDVILFCGLSVGLATVVPPPAAGVGAFFLPVLPGMVESLMGHPSIFVRWSTTLLYHLAPARMPESLMGTEFWSDVRNPNYGLFAGILAEHALYAAVALVLGCMVFARREIRLGS